eukprot:1157312-Pelagomonas_calceolata.AAC.4
MPMTVWTRTWSSRGHNKSDLIQHVGEAAGEVHGSRTGAASVAAVAAAAVAAQIGWVVVGRCGGGADLRVGAWVATRKVLKDVGWFGACEEVKGRGPQGEAGPAAAAADGDDAEAAAAPDESAGGGAAAGVARDSARWWARGAGGELNAGVLAYRAPCNAECSLQGGRIDSKAA